MNDGQRAHIEERLRAGDSQEAMVQYLVSEGVDEATAQAGVAEVAASQSAGSRNALPAVSDLLRLSWQFVTTRTDLVGWYVVVSLVPIVVFGVLGILGVLATEATPAAIGLVLLFGLLALVAVVWFMVTASAGLMYAVVQSGEEAVRFRRGWEWARPLFWQIVIVGLLTSLVLFTSALALVIPAFIVFVYVAFYFLEFVRHDRRGLHALAASTHLVYGHFWPVALRLGAMLLLMLLVNIALSIVFGLGEETVTATAIIGEVIAMVVGFFLTVMFVRYLAQLHSALVANSTPYAPEPHSQSYKIYRALAIIGAGLLVLIPVFTLLALLGFAA
jgi:hypothetical protein